MKWQAIVVLVWLAIELGWAFAKDGQPKPPYSGAAEFVAIATLLMLLWGGEFFDGGEG